MKIYILSNGCVKSEINFFMLEINLKLSNLIYCNACFFKVLTKPLPNVVDYEYPSFA